MSKSKNDKKPAAPKKPKTDKIRTPWGQKTQELIQKIANSYDRLSTRFGKAKPAGDYSAALESTGGGIKTLYAFAGSLGDWTPSRGGGSKKPTIGSLIAVKAEALAEPVFAVIPSSTFLNAKIVGEDGKQSWLVTCADGVTCSIRRKLVQKAG